MKNDATCVGAESDPVTSRIKELNSTRPATGSPTGGGGGGGGGSERCNIPCSAWVNTRRAAAFYQSLVEVLTACTVATVEP